MKITDILNEEKVRLDPKCWKGKKIGNPKTKMKGGVRVNNCVPAESIEEDAVADFIARGGQVQQGKLHPPRKAERWQGSSHIGAAGGRGTKGTVSGRAANTNPRGGKPVVSAEGFNPEYDDEAGMADNNLETLRRAVDGIDELIDPGTNLPEWCQEKIAKAEQMLVGVWDYMRSEKDRGAAEELAEEFDLIESIIDRIAAHNGVDAEVVWTDLESLTEDELYVFAVTSEPIMESSQQGEYSRVLTALGLYYPRLSMDELNTPGYHKVIADKANVPVEYAADIINGFANPKDDWDDEEDVMEDWQKVNKRDKTDGMSRKAVKAYRREHPGSKLKTAVTTKPSKLKKGSKASKRRSEEHTSELQSH